MTCVWKLIDMFAVWWSLACKPGSFFLFTDILVQRLARAIEHYIPYCTVILKLWLSKSNSDHFEDCVWHTQQNAWQHQQCSSNWCGLLEFGTSFCITGRCMSSISCLFFSLMDIVCANQHAWMLNWHTFKPNMCMLGTLCTRLWYYRDACLAVLLLSSMLNGWLWDGIS